MKQNIIFGFGSIYSNFCKNEVSPGDISKIVDIIQFNSQHISIAAKKKLLEIPFYVMDNNLVELNTDEKAWANKNGNYFHGNSGNPAASAYATLFASNSFTFADMTKFLEFLMQHKDALNDPFLPRNIEVTLRDDVKVPYQKRLNDLGLLFAKTLDAAFLL